jgi:hypothetical protein
VGLGSILYTYAVAFVANEKLWWSRLFRYGYTGAVLILRLFALHGNFRHLVPQLSNIDAFCTSFSHDFRNFENYIRRWKL